MNSDSNPETRRATAPEGAPMEKNIRDELKSPPPEATMEARREQRKMNNNVLPEPPCGEVSSNEEIFAGLDAGGTAPKNPNRSEKEG